VFRAEAKGKKLHFETVGVIGANEVFGDRESLATVDADCDLRAAERRAS
jgi:hypothetical protein